MPVDGDDVDPWDFLPTRPARASSPDSGDPAPPAVEEAAAPPVRRRPVRDPLAALDDLAAGAPPPAPRAAAEPHGRARGEIRAAAAGPSLRRRAWPLALALALVLFAGFVTEMVGASQMIALAGPQSLLVMYPLGGLGLLALGLLQFRFVDRAARLPMLRAVTLGYAVVFVIALALIASSVVPVLATGMAWLLADQLMFLIPLLIWSLAGDEFNVAEGRRIFPWIVSWTYAGQVLGLAVATAAPAALTAAGIPLPMLLVVDPVICVFLGLWLPRALRGSLASRGSGKEEPLSASLRGAWDFVDGVPVWRSYLVLSLLVFAAGMTAHLSFMAGAGEVLGSDAAGLQTLLAGVSLASFLVCWPIQSFAAQPLQERLGIPGVLMILPVASVVSGVLLAVGAATQSLPLLVAGISFFRIPRWSVDENVRRAALAFVPDDRRARVSFLVDLGPMGLGLVAAGVLGSLGLLLGLAWVPAALAALVAAAAVPFAVRVRRGWDDSLLSWRLRRRKQNRTLEL